MTKSKKYRKDFIDYLNTTLQTEYKYFPLFDSVRYREKHLTKNVKFNTFYDMAMILLEQNKAVSPFVYQADIEVSEPVKPLVVRHCQTCKATCNKSYFFCDKHIPTIIFQDWGYGDIIPGGT